MCCRRSLDWKSKIILSETAKTPQTGQSAILYILEKKDWTDQLNNTRKAGRQYNFLPWLRSCDRMQNSPLLSSQPMYDLPSNHISCIWVNVRTQYSAVNVTTHASVTSTINTVPTPWCVPHIMSHSKPSTFSFLAFWYTLILIGSKKYTSILVLITHGGEQRQNYIKCAIALRFIEFFIYLNKMYNFLSYKYPRIWLL